MRCEIMPPDSHTGRTPAFATALKFGNARQTNSGYTTELGWWEVSEGEEDGGYGGLGIGGSNGNGSV